MSSLGKSVLCKQDWLRGHPATPLESEQITRQMFLPFIHLHVMQRPSNTSRALWPLGANTTACNLTGPALGQLIFWRGSLGMSQSMAPLPQDNGDDDPRSESIVGMSDQIAHTHCRDSWCCNGRCTKSVCCQCIVIQNKHHQQNTTQKSKKHNQQFKLTTSATFSYIVACVITPPVRILCVCVCVCTPAGAAISCVCVQCYFITPTAVAILCVIVACVQLQRYCVCTSFTTKGFPLCGLYLMNWIECNFCYQQSW